MKKLIYQVEGYTGQYNPETKAVEQVPTLARVMKENPTEEDIAKAAMVAYNGEYSLEDDGQPEPQTPEQRIAELEQALELLLSGVTE